MTPYPITQPPQLATIMGNNLQPSFANGKICYIEIPALDIVQSSTFYKNVFGWTIREDHGGHVSFNDTAGQVSGMWVLGRGPATKPGLLISIMVCSVSDTLELIVENSGKVVQAPDNKAQEVTARFADPAGNVFCLCQDPEAIKSAPQKRRWAKWGLGIAMAGLITLGPANFLMHHTGNVDMNNLSAFQYWIQFLTVPAVAFGLFLFLACAFVPVQKRTAGMLVFALSLVFIALGAYQHYTDDGFLRNDYLVRYFGFILCLLVGFGLSYRLFKQNKWTSN
jgi:hypothetical protein